jgi:hypothetical protein
MNCAWFCHADGKCYGIEQDELQGEGFPLPKEWINDSDCVRWAFDGLEDWEREDTLVTMEMAK